MAVNESAGKRRAGVKRAAIGAGVLLAVAAGALAFVYHSIHEPHAGFRGEQFLEIELGATSREMAELLARRGIVREPWLFLAVRAAHPRVILQAGEYRFAGPASAWEVLDRLARGDVFYHSITIPEGTNIHDTAQIIAGLDWIDEEEVRALVESPDLIADLAPEARSLEGYLFPSTYRVTRNTPALAVCEMMVGEFRRVWLGLGSDADVHETATLASLIEKETAVSEERRLISSVFHRRLERGIKLACDPTVIYAAILEDRYDGVIHRSDLDSENAYNTYQHAGLPPGPIASPGRAALYATLHPAQTEYLFFVAKPDGSGAHEFSKSLAEHNRAVGRYRRGIRNAKRQSAPRRVSRPETIGDSN